MAGTQKRHRRGSLPLLAFLDHGAAGTCGTLAILLRPGSTGFSSATDHSPWLVTLAHVSTALEI